MKRKVLIIAHDFPPNGITSSRRPGAMAKYLGCYGWEPYVLTQAWDEENCNFDGSIVPNLPSDIKIYKVDIREKLESKVRRGIEQFFRFVQPQRNPYHFMEEAKNVALTAIKDNRIDLIWATAPQGAVLEVASYAARESGIPWVADFRDVHQWSPNWFSKLTRPLKINHEKRQLKSASALTAVSKGFADTLSDRHGKDVAVVSHGFDDELVEGLYPDIIRKFNIVYTGGVVLGNPDLSPLLDAVGNLISKGLVTEDDITIEFFGKGNAERLAKLFGGHEYSGIVKDFGPVPRDLLIGIQRNAALLLVASHPGVSGWITSKMFEYIVARRPILSFPNDHDCIDEMIRDLGLGHSCNSLFELERVLLEYYIEWKKSQFIEFRGKKKLINEYCYKNQIKIMSELFDSVMAESNA